MNLSFIVRSPEKLLLLLLWMIAAHSLVVGFMLILQPPGLMHLLGFSDIHERFFPFQGGVFHVIMAFFYTLAGINSEKNRILVVFAIIVKLAASVFLGIYYVKAEPKWIIMVSAIPEIELVSIESADD